MRNRLSPYLACILFSVLACLPGRTQPPSTAG